MQNIKSKYKKIEKASYQYFWATFSRDNLKWRQTLEEDGGIKKKSSLQKQDESYKNGLNIALAETVPMSRSQEEELLRNGQVYSKFMDSIDRMTKISLKDLTDRFDFSRLIRALIYYRLEEKDKNLLNELICNVSIPVSIFRSDVISNGLTTEIQVASGGWSLMHRIADSPQELGYEIMYDFYESVSNNSFNGEKPVICFVVHKGLLSYWEQFMDCAYILNQKYGKGTAYVTMPEGIACMDSGVYFVANNGDKYKLDIIYSLGDIYRFFHKSGRHILEAVSKGHVLFHPTLNPLLNNTQLCFSLLNHSSTSEWLKYDLGIRDFEKLKKIIVNYYLAEEEGEVFVPISNKLVRFLFKNVLQVLSVKVREGLVIRYILTSDLRKFSGGWGVVKASKVTETEFSGLVTRSFRAFQNIRLLGKLSKVDSIVALAAYHSSRLKGSIRVAKRVGDEICEFEIANPRISDSCFYLKRGDKVKIAGYYRQYADPKDTGIKIGGSSRAIGPVNVGA